MPDWNTLVQEIGRTKGAKGGADAVRQKYLRRLARLTGRNVIAYYSGWLQLGGVSQQGVSFEIDDTDKAGFMAAIHGHDREARARGLDLLLHTPGGDVAATESLVAYLRAMYGNNIRAVVPQLALSAGTMVALACKRVLMGKQSSLGPIDPEVQGYSAYGVLEEFRRARQAVAEQRPDTALWQAIVAQYPPTLVGDCRRNARWAREMTAKWLATGMFAGRSDAESHAEAVARKFADRGKMKTHTRHVSAELARELGLVVESLEDDQALQDAVLTVHHAYLYSFGEGGGAYKIIENGRGLGVVQSISLPEATP